MNECIKIIKKALKEKRSTLTIIETKKICNLHNIPIPPSYLTSNIDDAVLKANKVGYPIVLKVSSPQIVHKSDLEGVILNIKDEENLKIKYKKLIKNLKEQKSVDINGIIVEKMMKPSTEVIVGGLRDLQFGPVIMFGIGGVFTEIYEDIEFRVAPLDKIDAVNMINDIKGIKILKEIRGRQSTDIDSIIQILLNVSNLMLEHNTISQLDLNPIIVYSKRVCAVDSRIIIRKTGEKV